MPILRPTTSIAQQPSTDVDVQPQIQRPRPRRQGSSSSTMLHMELSPQPVPPSLLRRLTPEPLTYALPSPSLHPNSQMGMFNGAYRLSPSPVHSQGSSQGMPRTPSPLPPMAANPLPSEIETMTARLNTLVAQSNSYVQGLVSRMESIENQRHSMGPAVNREQMEVFLETNADFAGLDIGRVLQFRLPIEVWQRLASQIVREHGSAPDTLVSILYWRSRYEAEAMGTLASDRRNSSVSSGSSQPLSVEAARDQSRRASASSLMIESQSVASEGQGSDSRRVSLSAPDPFGPRRATTTFDAIRERDEASEGQKSPKH